MSSSVNFDNNGKYILITGKGPTPRTDDTTLIEEEKYPINFTQSRKRFVLSLHYKGSSCFLFVNANKIYQFKARDSEIKDYALCLGNISKDFTINNMKKKKKTRLEGVIITAIYEKMFGLGMTTLIISNEEMNDIMKIVRSLEESVFFKKDVSETIKNKVKRTKIRISKYVIRNIRGYFIKKPINK